MDTEDWILKGKKLITNTKKQRLKICSRGQTLNNAIFKKENKVTKIIKNMKFALKNGVFFFNVIVGYKNENQRSNKELKNKKTILKIKKMVIVKYIQEFLWSC